VKVKLFISALIAALLVMGPVAHAATHDVIPDGAQEFVECYGCSNASAAVQTPHTYCEPQTSVAYSVLTTGVVLSTHFNNYSSRAPPTK
jgi:hypothetical protein